MQRISREMLGEESSEEEEEDGEGGSKDDEDDDEEDDEEPAQQVQSRTYRPRYTASVQPVWLMLLSSLSICSGCVPKGGPMVFSHC
jgi:hypothetical protein